MKRKKLNFDLSNPVLNEVIENPGKADHLSAMVFDLEKAKERFSIYEEKLETLKAECQALEVVDELSAATATQIIGSCRKLSDDIKELMNRIIYKPDDYVRSVKGFCKIFFDVLNKIALDKDSVLQSKLELFAYDQELKRRKEQKELEDKLARRQIKMNEESEAAGVESQKLPEMVIPKKNEPIRTFTGSSSSKMVWDFEILEPENVPRQFCDPSNKKIKAAVKGGIRKIEGVRIFERAKVRTRKA